MIDAAADDERASPPWWEATVDGEPAYTSSIADLQTVQVLVNAQGGAAA